MRRALTILAAALVTAACTAEAPKSIASSAPTTPAGTARAVPGSPSVLAKGLEAPWGLAFLPDGTALVTERDSRQVLSVTPSGTVTEVAVIEEADAHGEGGLMGIA